MSSRIGLNWLLSAGTNAALTLFAALSILGLPAATRAQQPQITTFDVPASDGNGTVPIGINLAGVIVGNYYDANGVSHGFLRNPNGTFTTFDSPGAGIVSFDSNGTFPEGINLLGVVAGYYNDSNLVSHCFIRTPDGKITTFDVPGADINPADQLGSIVTGINAFGTVSGYYFDSSGLSHGFLRAPDGKFTPFDAPSAGELGTYPVSPVNIEGAVAGLYSDSNSLYHAFVRNPDGTFVTLSFPGACDTSVSAGCNGASASGINDPGTVAGAYRDNSGNNVARAYLRARDGTLTTFEAPGAGDGYFEGTGGSYAWFGVTVGLNNLGATAATLEDNNNVFHGYIRSPQGTIVTFDAPGASLAPGSFAGTVPDCINDLGVVSGFYIDANYVSHGFLRIP